MHMIDISGKHHYYNKLIFISVSMCIYVHVRIGVLRGQKVLDPLELKERKLQKVVSCLTWGWETNSQLRKRNQALLLSYLPSTSPDIL